MRRKRLRAGLTGVEQLVGVLMVMVVGLGIWTWTLNSKLKALGPTSTTVAPIGSPAVDLTAINSKLAALDSITNALNVKGQALTAWIGDGDSPEINATGGLTKYLIALKNKLTPTLYQTITGARDSGAHHQHADPPPPPPW